MGRTLKDVRNHIFDVAVNRNFIVIRSSFICKQNRKKHTRTGDRSAFLLGVVVTEALCCASPLAHDKKIPSLLWAYCSVPIFKQQLILALRSLLGNN